MYKPFLEPHQYVNSDFLTSEETNMYREAYDFKYDEPYFPPDSYGGKMCQLANIVTKLLNEVNNG